MAPAQFPLRMEAIQLRCETPNASKVIWLGLRTGCALLGFLPRISRTLTPIERPGAWGSGRGACTASLGACQPRHTPPIPATPARRGGDGWNGERWREWALAGLDVEPHVYRQPPHAAGRPSVTWPNPIPNRSRPARSLRQPCKASTQAAPAEAARYARNPSCAPGPPREPETVPLVVVAQESESEPSFRWKPRGRDRLAWVPVMQGFAEMYTQRGRPFRCQGGRQARPPHPSLEGSQTHTQEQTQQGPR